jgi:hypothetical protein
MTAEGDPSRQLARLVLSALDNPETADPNALLVAADAFLNVVRQDGTEPELTDATRDMANAACDWAVFGDGADHTRLENCAKAYWMVSQLLKPTN